MMLNNIQQAIQLINQNVQAQNHPTMKNAKQMKKNNNISGMQEIAQNLAKERGVDLNEFIKNFQNANPWFR